MGEYFNNGHRLHYTDYGTGPLLLILPGNTASSACHQGELEYFGRRFRAVSLDFWGTGGSDRLATWPDDWWERGAQDAAALVEHLSYKDAVVMGCSGGAIVALLMAALLPSRVKVVIADSCPERFTIEQMELLLADRRQRTPGQLDFWHYAQGDDWEQVVAADTEMLIRLAGRGGEWAHGRVGQIRCPVMFTGSLLDESIPGAGLQMVAMAKQVPNSQLYLVNNGGHPLMWTRPNEFRLAVDGFLRYVSRQQS